MRGRLFIAGALVVLLAGCSSSTPATGTKIAFAARPVLCHAPLFSPPPTAGAAALPACAPQYQLTASRLDVKLNPSTYAGYTATLDTPPDPQFASYPSTSGASDLPSRTVLLAGAPTNQTRFRYVLGPVGLTRSSVSSAIAYDEGGIWVNNVVLTSSGTAAWNALSKSQFHAQVAFVVNGEVLTATMIEPTQKIYTPSESVIQINAGLSEQQTKALAGELSS